MGANQSHTMTIDDNNDNSDDVDGRDAFVLVVCLRIVPIFFVRIAIADCQRVMQSSVVCFDKHII